MNPYKTNEVNDELNNSNPIVENGSELRCSGKVSSPCSTSGTVMLLLKQTQW